MVNTRSQSRQNSDVSSNVGDENLANVDNMNENSNVDNINTSQTTTEQQSLENTLFMLETDIGFTIEFVESEIIAKDDFETLEEAIDEIEQSFDKVSLLVEKLTNMVSVTERTNIYSNFSRLKIRVRTVTAKFRQYTRTLSQQVDDTLAITFRQPPLRHQIRM